MDKSSLLEKLRKTDEVLLLELLEITSEELVDAFYDKIQERYSYLERQVEDEQI